jgi:hypothetical protein
MPPPRCTELSTRYHCPLMWPYTSYRAALTCSNIRPNAINPKLWGPYTPAPPSTPSPQRTTVRTTVSGQVSFNVQGHHSRSCDAHILPVNLDVSRR